MLPGVAMTIPMRGTSRFLRAIAAALPLSVALSSCANFGQPPAFAFYPNPEHPRDRSMLAQLQGQIATIDGIDVEPYGTVFDVLPGCHVVSLRRKVGEGNVSGAWMADLGKRIYAFRMRSGYLYTIDISARFGSGAHGTLSIMAAERDATGRVVQEVPLARRYQDVEACRAWEGAAMPETPQLLDQPGAIPSQGIFPR
jgi:hypothetical protein